MSYIQDCQNQEILLDSIVGSSMTQQDELGYRIKLAEKPQFKRAWFKNISEYFYMDLYERWDGAVERNKLIRLAGSPGGGKSLLSISLVAMARDWFGFEYKNFFSKMDASIWMVMNAYEAQKYGKAISRFYINVDEDAKTYGVSSGQDDTFFEGFMEFLRARQVNVNICNPFDLGGRTFDTQLEVVGYTKQNYAKAIVYEKIDKWTSEYRPLGYIVSKIPPINYITSYKIEKDKFTKNYMSNLSSRVDKDTTILDLVHRDMASETKELIKAAILDNPDNRDCAQLIRYGAGRNREGLQIFNLPEKYVQILVQSFKWRFYDKEMQESYRRKAERVVKKGIKKGNLRAEWKNVLLTPEEGQERMEGEESKEIKPLSVLDKRAKARRADEIGER